MGGPMSRCSSPKSKDFTKEKRGTGEEVAEVQLQHQELGQALDLGLDLEVVELDGRQLQHCAVRLRIVGERTVQPEQHECEEDRRITAACRGVIMQQ